MPELVILLARVSSISKFSRSLLKWLLKISASSSCCEKPSPRREERQFSKISIVGDNST